jgi:thiamine-phosphate pyrophosphorylase
MKQAVDSCQVFLMVPSKIDRTLVQRFAEQDGLGDAACVLLCADGDAGADAGFARALLDMAHDANIPLIIEKDVTAAAELGADGVHIAADEEAYAQARRLLGDDRIVGAECTLSRHAAMTMGELGADYVAFAGRERGALEEMIVWWSEVIVIPCVAWDVPDLETARRLAGAGADFVAAGKLVWSHPDGPAAAMGELVEILSTDRVAA